MKDRFYKVYLAGQKGPEKLTTIKLRTIYKAINKL